MLRETFFVFRAASALPLELFPSCDIIQRKMQTCDHMQDQREETAWL